MNELVQESVKVCSPVTVQAAQLNAEADDEQDPAASEIGESVQQILNENEKQTIGEESTNADVAKKEQERLEAAAAQAEKERLAQESKVAQAEEVKKAKADQLEKEKIAKEEKDEKAKAEMEK